MTSFSHLNDQNHPEMVDVGKKRVTARFAEATAIVHLPPPVWDLLDGDELIVKKGPVFQTAIVAGTMACKKTADIIPLCHPLPIESCRFQMETGSQEYVKITCQVSVHHKTGVEMEALTGASVAALTIYDMCKGISQEIVIGEILVVGKTGGKSDFRKV